MNQTVFSVQRIHHTYSVLVLAKILTHKILKSRVPAVNACCVPRDAQSFDVLSVRRTIGWCIHSKKRKDHAQDPKDATILVF